MSLPLHVLPSTRYDDKLKKSFIHQLSLNVELNRNLSSTVSPPHIVIFQPQGGPTDEFDGVVQPFLGNIDLFISGNSNCRNIILFTAFATSQRYGRGFTPDCVSRFKYTDKLFITSGHLDTQINKSTFERLGAILVNEYEFKQVTDDQSQLGHSTGSDANSQVDKGKSAGRDADSQVDKGKSIGTDADSHVDRNYSIRRYADGQVDRDHSTVSEANSQGERDHSTGIDAGSQVGKKHSFRSDANIQVDNAHSTRKDANSKGGKAHLTVNDATDHLDNGSSDLNSETGIICNLGDINRLWTIRQEIERETTDLQRKVEKRFALQPGKLLRILEAVMEHLDHRQEAAATSEMRGISPPLSGDDMASTIEDRLVLEKGSLDKIIQALLESGHNHCVHSGTGCDQNVDDIDRLRKIKDEMKTKTTDLQLRVETKLKLPVGILPRILYKVLIHLEQEREAAATLEIKERSPPLLRVDVAGEIEKQLELDEGSVNKIITSLLKVKPDVSKGDIPGRLKKVWNNI
ncbi:uncharacterized protein [Haliotis cracherodii]|uniref:uncharacterized protein n=1 Tax=Haliotis cracherodii TaxID=6455 RepID=UPI0039E97B2C